MKKWIKTTLSGLLCLITVFGSLMGCTDNGGNSDSNFVSGSNTDSESSGNSDSGSSKDEDVEYCTVTFDLCTDLETTTVLPQEVEKGDQATKPIVGVISENPKNSEVEGWYLDKEYTQPWIFLIDEVEEDMTLYAKWVNKFDVYYYLGDETENFMFKEQYREGALIVPNYSLADGFRSNGFFADPEFTQEFDFTKPVEGDTNIYIHRSDEFYFSPSMIAQRFVPQAAPSGTGSTAGSIELAKTEDGEEYAKVNFGYSTARDAHILLQYVTVDISHSQKIKFTMKNMGGADALKIYFVSWYDNETKEYVNGEVFGEDRAFTYKYTEDQMNMKPEDDWVEIEFDLAKEVTENGVPLWGESATLLKLRIDSGYVSADKDDLSNELWIKSIEGVKDPTYQPLDDTAEIKALLQNDDETAVKEAAEAQADVQGFIFPKDNGAAEFKTSEDGKQFVPYQKTNGLLLYTPFRTQNAQVTFDVGEEKIDLYENTTFVVRLQNLGYAKTIRMIWTNSRGRTGSSEFSIPSEMKEMQDVEFNMVGGTQWKDNLVTLTIEYDAVGVDNAILIESIQFLPYKKVEIAGFNFDDRNVFGLESNDSMAVEFSSTDFATKFTVNQAYGAVVEQDYSAYTHNTNGGYKYLALTYKQKAAGITKVNVTLTVDGVKKLYSFPVGVAAKMTEVLLPLETTGNISKFEMRFEGVGEIYIKNIRFKADENTSIDFSSTTFYSRMKADSTWSPTLSYDTGVSSAVLAPCNGGNPSKFYFGVTKGAASNGNFSLEGKSKVVIVYYNPGNVNQFVIGLGFTDITEDADWTTVISEAGSPGSGGEMHVDLEKNMKAGEWAVAEIPLSYFKYTENLAEKAVTMISFHHHDNDVATGDNVYIRLITII